MSALFYWVAIIAGFFFALSILEFVWFLFYKLFGGKMTAGEFMGGLE